MLILRCKVSFTYDRLGRCFRSVYIYACIAVFSVLLPFLGEMNKGLYNIDSTDCILQCEMMTLLSPFKRFF